MRRIPMINLVIAAVLVVGCSGRELPTAPTATRSNVTLSPARTPTPGSPARRRAVSPAVPATALLSFSISTTSSHTLRQVRLTFDGRDVSTVEQPRGTSQMSITGSVSAAPGPHVIRLVVADQASSPNPYRAIGSITTRTSIYDLVPVEGSVATGEALEIRVTL
jgi:hypothetical protein